MISEVKNMDCMAYMAQFPDKFFDLAVVDPPYGIDAVFHATSRIAKYGQTKTVNDYKPQPEYFIELFRVSKNQIIWGYNHLSDMLPKCKEFIFWYKHQPVRSYSDGELAWTSFQAAAKCFDYPYFGGVNKEKNRIHPTQKPIALYAWIFEKFSRGGRRYWTLIWARVRAGSPHGTPVWTSTDASLTRNTLTRPMRDSRRRYMELRSLVTLLLHSNHYSIDYGKEVNR